MSPGVWRFRNIVVHPRDMAEDGVYCSTWPRLLLISTLRRRSIAGQEVHLLLDVSMPLALIRRNKSSV